jgi:hypothetical protein
MWCWMIVWMKRRERWEYMMGRRKERGRDDRIEGGDEEAIKTYRTVGRMKQQRRRRSQHPQG